MQKRALLQGEKFHRDVQTKYLRHRCAQSVRESGTQMPRTDVILSTDNDKVIVAQKYETADDRWAFVTRNVIVLQCFFRKIRAIRRVRLMREVKAKRQQAEEQAGKRRQELTERQRRKEIERRVHPKTLKDFALLYSGLETWRTQQAKKINATPGLTAEERQARLEELLNQEATLIQQLENLKVEAQEESRHRRTSRWLEQLAGSKEWPLSKGGVAHVDTPTTLRARELRDLYCSLADPSGSVDGRLHTLLQVKNTVKEYDCPLTQELFISVPEFNPAAGLTPFPHAANSAQKSAIVDSQSHQIYICKSCHRYQPSTKFHLSTTANNLGICNSCQDQKNAGSKRQCADEYVRILAAARLSEAALATSILPKHLRGGGSTGSDTEGTINTIDKLVKNMPSGHLDQVLIVNYMTEDDVSHIVQVIWNGHSAVSGNRHLSHLVLARWELDKPMSPWNTILLTVEEAHTHSTVSRDKLYSSEFVAKVQAKLALARRKWARLAELESAMEVQPLVRTRLAADERTNSLPPIAVRDTVGVGIGLVAASGGK
ncbi:hypothetical protein BCR44DRAFT_1513541 [Catenaria anguillulae PL171]|uniref:IQ motif and ubiquitin-like domain-containing protein n=1 Tax=Catenaria anguillulae PL171 TaxID=765915 RepID=A0A1Y2HN07_9FUNG|nr:hypothetical protein BCR44DRAFT_1513541 [Catenaria anguillulae PL171]